MSKLIGVAGQDWLEKLDEVEGLHVDRIQLSGLLLYRYYRLEREQ
jgi:hypothetical protein